MHGSTRQALRVDEMTQLGNKRRPDEMSETCPHCGADWTGDRETRELRNGRDFFIVWWRSRGATLTAIAKALGVTSAAIQQRYARIWNVYAQKCGMFDLYRRKGSCRIIGWYDQDGKPWALHYDTDENDKPIGEPYGARFVDHVVTERTDVVPKFNPFVLSV